MTDLLAELEKTDAQLQTGTKYTYKQLQEAFAKVQNPGHWKDSIDIVIPADQREIVAVAIPFFTATEATFEPIKNSDKLYVTAPGYWKGPAN